MKALRIIILLAACAINCNAQSAYGSNPLAHTYSIVAMDPKTGDIGVAVQSHWFSVGTVVIWGEAGVGVVATQSFVNPSFGLRGLALLKEGKTPRQAVDELLGSDSGKELRQLAILDINGKSATFTGKNCIPSAGHINRDNFSVQANLMSNDKIWPAMAEAFKKSEGPLAERLVIALEAAEKAGGDIRGRQSAALMVFKGKSSGKVWDDKIVDLRVDDNPVPLKELKRLLKVHRAYEHMNNGDLAVEKGDDQLAMKEYSAAEKMFPGNLEMKFWHAVALVNVGKLDESLPLFKEIFKKDANWKTLTPRLINNGMLKVTQEQLKRILDKK